MLVDSDGLIYIVRIGEVIRCMVLCTICRYIIYMLYIVMIDTLGIIMCDGLSGGCTRL